MRFTEIRFVPAPRGEKPEELLWHALVEAVGARLGGLDLLGSLTGDVLESTRTTDDGTVIYRLPDGRGGTAASHLLARFASSDPTELPALARFIEKTGSRPMTTVDEPPVVDVPIVDDGYQPLLIRRRAPGEPLIDPALIEVEHVIHLEELDDPDFVRDKRQILWARLTGMCGCPFCRDGADDATDVEAAIRAWDLLLSLDAGLVERATSAALALGHRAMIDRNDWGPADVQVLSDVLAEHDAGVPARALVAMLASRATPALAEAQAASFYVLELAIGPGGGRKGDYHVSTDLDELKRILMADIGTAGGAFDLLAMGEVISITTYLVGQKPRRVNLLPLMRYRIEGHEITFKRDELVGMPEPDDDDDEDSLPERIRDGRISDGDIAVEIDWTRAAIPELVEPLLTEKDGSVTVVTSYLGKETQLGWGANSIS